MAKKEIREFIKLGETAIETFNKNIAFIKSGKMKYDKTEEEMAKYGYANSIKPTSIQVGENLYVLELSTKFLTKKDTGEIKLGTTLTWKTNDGELEGYKAVSAIENFIVENSKFEIKNKDVVIEKLSDLLVQDVVSIKEGAYIKSKKYYLTKNGISSKPSDEEQEMVIITNPYIVLKQTEDYFQENKEELENNKQAAENKIKQNALNHAAEVLEK